MMYVVQIHYRKNELPKLEAFFWYITLVVLAFIVIIPETANFVTETFDVSRLTDFLTAVAFMIVFVMLINTRIQVHKLRQKLETKTRKTAIDRILEK